MTDHVIVLPGGGYGRLSDNESTTIVAWLETLGLSASVFRYPVGKAARHPAVLDAVRAANPDAVMLGVTATPFRNDGKGLGRFWDRVAYRMSIADAIRDGYLVPLRGLRVELQIDLADVKVSKGSGDFVDASLGEVIDTDEARREIVRAWRQNVGPGTTDGGPAGRKTAAFTPTVAAAQHLAAEGKAIRPGRGRDRFLRRRLGPRRKRFP